jgi:hypothetical protein
MGNQTTFKKGLIPWNKGMKLIRKINCNYCGEEFTAKKKRTRYCTLSCAAKDNTGFKKGQIPWSKGGGYTTSKKGQSVPEEVRRKISETLKGRFNMGNSKPILQINKISDEIINEFPSAAEAARQTGISHSSILNTFCGYSKTAGGYKWRKRI